MTRLFKTSKNSTLINYGLPYFFLILIISELLFDLSYVSKSLFVLWIVDVLLFNLIHVGLTFINIFFIAEYRQVLKVQKVSLIKAFAVFSLIAAFFISSYRGSPVMLDTPLKYLLIVVMIFFRAFHTYKQSLGFSLQLNAHHLHKTSEENQSEFFKIESESRKYEKLAVWLLILGSLPAGYIAFRNELNFGISVSAMRVAAISLFVVGLMTMVFSFLKLKHLSLIKNKIAFSARFLVYACAPFTLMGFLGSKSIHGVEYFLFQEQVFKNSRIEKRKYLMLGIGTVIFMAFHVALIFPHAPFGFQIVSVSNRYLDWAIMLNVIVTFFHYYLDSKLYEMKNPEVRKIMAPIFNKVPRAFSAANAPAEQSRIVS